MSIIGIIAKEKRVNQIKKQKTEEPAQIETPEDNNNEEEKPCDCDACYHCLF